MNKIIKFNTPNKNNFSSFELKKLYNKSNYINDYYSQICVTKIAKILKTNKKILLTNSCSSSLEIAALCIKNTKKFRAKSNIIMPSYTFPSTANAFIKFGYKIKFIDINHHDLMITAESVLNAIDSNTIGLVNVYYGSHVNNPKKLLKICKENGMFFIEDSAQSFGTKIDGESIGTFGEFGCFSFHQTKNLHSGFGGALVVDKKFYNTATMILDRGTDREFIGKKGNKKKFYDWCIEGGSYMTSEFNSFFLSKELDKFYKIKNIRSKIFNNYINFFNKYKKYLHFINVPDNLISNYHSFWIMFKNKNLSKNYIKYMKSKNIDCFIGYRPLHTSKFYLDNFKKMHLKNTEFCSDVVVRIPFHNYLTIREQKEIMKYSKIYLESI